MVKSYNSNEIDVGDRVRITSYLIGRLYPNPVQDERTVGKEGIVTKKRPTFWVSGDPKGFAFDVRLFEHHPRDFPTIMIDDHDHGEDMVLVSKGDGTCIGGVHYQFTEEELRWQRWDAWNTKCFTEWDHKATGQGFSNAPTFLAHLYLNNERGFPRWLKDNRRKDGTINAKKVEKWFYDHRLKIDDWAYLPPFDIPAEFATGVLPNRPRVNWTEVAEQFADKGAAQ